MKLVCVSLIFSLVLIGGCSPMSIQEIRDEPAQRRAVFQASYIELGNCVVDGLQSGDRNIFSGSPADLAYTVVHRAAILQLSVTGRSASAHNIPMLDILFVGSRSSDLATVETRPGGYAGARKGGESMEDAAWPVIHRCARELIKR